MTDGVRALILVALCTAPSVGCGSGDPQPTTIIEVQGQVVGRDGFGRGDLSVTILGHATVQTDANGAFVVPQVFVPYTLVVQQPGTGLIRPAIYLDLRRSDPTFLITEDTWTEEEGSVAGTVAVGASPSELLLMTSASHVHRVTSESTDAGGAYARSLTWRGPATTTVTLRALRYTLGLSALPNGYAGYGDITTSVHDGLTTIGQGIPVSPVGDAMIGGTFSAPPGEPPRWTVYLRWARHDQHTLMHSSVDPMLAVVPVLGGVLYDVRVHSDDLDTWGGWTQRTNVAPGTTDIHLEIPAPAQPLAPPEDGVFEVHDTLSADELPGRVYRFGLAPGNVGLVGPPLPPGPVRPTYMIYSEHAQVQVPDLAFLGLELPADTPYELSVATWGPYDSLDEAVGPTGMHDSTQDGQFFVLRYWWQLYTAP